MFVILVYPLATASCPSSAAWIAQYHAISGHNEATVNNVADTNECWQLCYKDYPGCKSADYDYVADNCHISYADQWSATIISHNNFIYVEDCQGQ